VVHRPAWMASAACRDAGVEVFFPARGVRPMAALALCAACTVRAECLAYAMADREFQGVWGGTSERERRRLRMEHLGRRGMGVE